MNLRGVIVSLDWAQALGAELYSGGGGWASWLASWLAGWPASWPAGLPTSLPAYPGCQIATIGREQFTFAKDCSPKKLFWGQNASNHQIQTDLG